MIRNTAVIAAVAAEALAVYVAAELLAAGYGPANRHAIGAWLFVLVAFLGFGLPRLLDELDLSPRANIAIAGAVAYVALYGAIRISFAGDFAIWDLSWALDFVRDAGDALQRGGRAMLGAGLLIALWARASYRSNEEVELELIPRAVGIPFILVTALVVAGAASTRSGEIGRGGVAFYAVAVLAMSCSQLALSGATFGELRAGGITAMLLGATVAVTIGAVVLFGIVFGVLGPALGSIIGRAVEVVLTVLLTPVAWVLERLFQYLLGGARLPDLTDATRTASQQANQGPGEDASPIQTAGGYLLRIFALLVVLGGVALVVAWYMRLRRRTGARTPSQGERSAAGALGDDLRGIFHSLFRRGGGTPTPAGSEAERLYLDVLARARQKGHPRDPADTPGEFAPELQDAFASELQRAAEVSITDDITAAFEQARYGGHEPDARTIADLRRRWDMLR
ncbi:MAG: DUF4129 domain-containing protein [Chloroflexi bacterium]|nr:DUF4129 domain-containing protein [Chloroflexota bacterium]